MWLELSAKKAYYKYKGANGRSGRSGRHQHPYNQHAQEKSADGCLTSGKEYIQQSGLQRTHVHHPDPADKQELASNDVERESNQAQKTFAATFCGYPSEDEEMDMV